LATVSSARLIRLVVCRGVTITMKGASFMYALRS